MNFTKLFAALAVIFSIAALPVSAQVFVPGGVTYSAASPLPATFGGLGPYALPTLASGSTDFFDGDSLTLGYGASSCSGTSSTPSGTCYADLVAIHDGAGETNVAVLGTCLEYTTTVSSACNQVSSTTGSLIQRYAHDAASISVGNRVYLLIGTNDVDLSPTDSQINPVTFRANLVTVAAAFSAAAGGPSNVILGEIPYNNQTINIPMYPALNKDIDDVAAQYGYSLAPNASSNYQCILGSGYTDTCLYTDLTHPDTLGHSYLAGTFETASYGQAVASNSATSKQFLSLFPFGIFPNTSGNVAYGYYSLWLSRAGTGSTAIDDTAFGYRALSANITGGQYNTATGYQSLTANTSAQFNTADGYNSLLADTTGGQNTAIGALALKTNLVGVDDVAVGVQALQNSTTSTNTAVGWDSGQAQTSGIENTSIGYDSLYNLTTGSYDSAIGNQAGQFIANGTTANTTSGNSTYIGYDTKANANGDTAETVIGYNATGIGSNSITIQSGTSPGYYSGTGAPTFSAPNGSQYLRYDGTTGSRVYYNTSGASSSGTTWSAQSSP